MSDSHAPGQLSASERQSFEDNKWAIANYEELERCYSGEYVLIFDKQVIAHGTDATVLFQQAMMSGRAREDLVLFAVLPSGVEVPH